MIKLSDRKMLKTNISYVPILALLSAAAHSSKWLLKSCHGGRFMDPATSKVELFVGNVNGPNVLIFITNDSCLDVAVFLPHSKTASLLSQRATV